jgi:hypothetical protein
MLLIYMFCELFIFKDKFIFEITSIGNYAKFSFPLIYNLF